MIQAHNLEVVKIIQERQKVNSNSALVRRIFQLLQLVGFWRIQHFPREENRVADSLVKMVSDKKDGV
ncbi:hypothetical protein Golob_025691 [Gossypium lobatum]|uniref:RNase H type-1 domain-containing protein n=1 Tax=Gossypium lobatum TaxID=34289 RepID=A0A7J8LSU6_9ROSI|nr:hypothetical protein [Gossypium lobatum]